MTQKKTIGLLTIGQSPRKDMTADLEPIFRENIEYMEAGALNGLTLAEVLPMAPKAGEHFLVTRLADGTMVTVASHHLEQRMQHQVSQLEAAGVSAILILCTEKFAPFRCSVPVFYPNDMLKEYIRNHYPAAHLGVILPEEGQMEDFAGVWRQSFPHVTAAHGSPYLKDGSLETAADAFAETDVDLIVLDCMGYSAHQQEMTSERSGKPVLLSRTLAAQLLVEQI